MRTHKQLAHWYHQLAQHLDAGISLPEAMAFTEGPPTAGRMALKADLESGLPIDACLQRAPKWLPHEDRIFIASAAETGCLPQTFENLSERHTRIAKTQTKVIFSLIYPMGVFHLAAFALPLIQMIDFQTGFEWSFADYLMRVCAMLIPVWALIAMVCLLTKTRNPILPAILRRIPLLAKYSHFQAIANFADSMATFVNAGLPIQSAWQGAVHISGDPRIHKAYGSIRTVFDHGEDPGPQMKAHKIFPPDLVAYYHAGQRSGRLDQTMKKAGAQFQEQANQALNTAAIIYPTLLFALVASFIVYAIFQVYGGYLDNITHIMD